MLSAHRRTSIVLHEATKYCQPNGLREWPMGLALLHSEPNVDRACKALAAQRSALNSAGDMALRGLCGGLKKQLHRTAKRSATLPSVLSHTDLARHQGYQQSQAVLAGCPTVLDTQRVCEHHIGFAAQLHALAGAAAPEPALPLYRVQVVTGDVRGAGTQAPAVITIYGESGQSRDIDIGHDQDESGFERGSIKYYDCNVEQELGALKRIHVEQLESSVTDTGSGWYLDKIEVTSPSGQLTVFPCHSWLGKNDAGDISGPVTNQRNLAPCEHSDLPAKPIQDLERPLVVQASAISVPHPDKVTGSAGKAVNRKKLGWGGEDAYFCSDNVKGLMGLGVADGVYQWREKGIDAGEFSRLLMHTALDTIEAGQPDVFKVMQAAAKQVTDKGTQGSSTCCIVLVDSLHGRLASANIGDSGFMILGRTDYNPEPHVKFRTPQQEHQFGCPYQLGHHKAADPPEDAMLTALPVIPGDFLVLGSDGLFDNVSDDVILAEVQKQLAAKKRASFIAQRLCAIAFNNSVDKDAVTPYSVAATEAFDMVYSGGKKDDITVIAAHIQ